MPVLRCEGFGPGHRRPNMEIKQQLFSRHEGPILKRKHWQDAALFPQKIGDRWAPLHRPAPQADAHGRIGAHTGCPGVPICGTGAITPSHSCPVRAAGEMPTRSGLGPPPMLTDYGWLILYHGVRATCVER
jgi:predicted GH43/DUF377 family glycosyl hydrolase